jgi:hypothetical protein
MNRNAPELPRSPPSPPGGCDPRQQAAHRRTTSALPKHVDDNTETDLATDKVQNNWAESVEFKGHHGTDQAHWWWGLPSAKPHRTDWK